MIYLAITLAFCYGTIFGSFFNVLIDRLPNDEDIFVKKSSCSYCHHTLKWYDMIPVFSYLFLLGKCRYCKKKLSPQYLFSELFVGLIFAFSMWFYGYEHLLSVVIAIVFLSMLYVVSMIDLKNKIIIDQVVITFTVIGVILRIVQMIVLKQNVWMGILWMLVSGVAGFTLYFLIYMGAKLILKKEGFGQGDIVLLTGVGLFLDYKQTLAIGFLAFYVALIFLIVGLIVNKVKSKNKCEESTIKAAEEEETLKQDGIVEEKAKENDEKNILEEEEDVEEDSSISIPFGPSISIVAAVFLLYGEQIIGLISRLLGFN